MGNTVVLKPATPAAIVGSGLVEILDDVGIPDGVLNFVTGSGSTVGSVLATDECIDAVSFTGSEYVGDIVYQDAAEDQKQVQQGVDGKNPTVVTESATLNAAIDIVGAVAFG